MVVSPIIVWGLVGLLLASCTVCTIAAAFAWRAAWPAGLRRTATELRERMELVELEWKRAQGQLAVQIEQLEELEETVERKRARVAARESYANRQGQQQQQQPAGDQRAELRRIARAQGHQV